MNKIIFLDIDGVLNSKHDYLRNKVMIKLYNQIYEYGIEYEFKRRLLDINLYKLELLKKIVYETNAKIVITSEWKHLDIYPLIEDYLINKGLPIVGTTSDFGPNRGKEIKDFLIKNKIDSFVIINDNVSVYLQELENYLVKTDYCGNGLDEEHVEEAVKILNRI